jgi:hypothetical protein
MNPKHDELATGELSIEELDGVAAGSIFGDAWRFIKGETTVKVDQYVTAARTLYNVGRSLIRLFC